MRYYYLVRRVSNWLDYLKFKFGGKQAAEVVFQLRGNGTPVTAYVPRRMMQTFKEIVFGNGYLRHARLGEAPVVVDIGANVGYFALLTLSEHPKARVFAFEPMPQNFRLLMRHKHGNPGFALDARNMAVWKDTTPLKLNFDASDEYTTAASLNRSIGQPDSVEVPCITLPDLFRDEKLSAIDLLKLDCEGSEYGILYSLPQDQFARIHNIAMEVHGNEGQIREMEEFLRARGYATDRDRDLITAWRA